MITKTNLLYNFILRANENKKIRTYYHLLEPLFHAMSDNNMYLNLGYHYEDKPFPSSVVKTQTNMVEKVTSEFKKSGIWLDAGCGTGAPACFLANKYNQLQIEGINIVETQIVKARNLAKKKGVINEAKFFFGDAQFIERGDEYFENIYAIESAFHFEDKMRFIKESFRTLKKGGNIAIADIILRPELASPIDFYKIAIAKHGLATKEFYSSEKWKHLLETSGFRNISIEDITINVASVLPEWINLIRLNEEKLLELYPKLFLDMLCKCLQYAVDKNEKSLFGYVIVRAKK